MLHSLDTKQRFNSSAINIICKSDCMGSQILGMSINPLHNADSIRWRAASREGCPSQPVNQRWQDKQKEDVGRGWVVCHHGLRAGGQVAHHQQSRGCSGSNHCAVCLVDQLALNLFHLPLWLPSSKCSQIVTQTVSLMFWIPTRPCRYRKHRRAHDF